MCVGRWMWVDLEPPMRILPVISLALFLGAGVALAASDEGVNPFRSDSSLDGGPPAPSRLVTPSVLIEL